MPHPTRSPLALAALATVAKPGLDVVATQPPRDPGADFDVLGVVDSEHRRWMVRSPRSDAAGAAMEAEVAILEHLATAVDEGLLPFEVPRPAGFAPLPEGGRAMLYPELVGSPVKIRELGPGSKLLAAVTRSIAALHDLPPALVRTAGLPDYEADAYRQRRLSELYEAARSGHIPARLLARWERALEDVAFWRFATTPIHGDLVAEHVVVDGTRVVGILDWADAKVADPADDLAWLLTECRPESFTAVLSTYEDARGRSDDGLEARAVLAGEMALVRWLMHGVRSRSDEIIEDAIDMLRDLDTELGQAPPIGQVEPLPQAPVITPGESAPTPDHEAEPAWDDDADPPVAGIEDDSGDARAPGHREPEAVTDRIAVTDRAPRGADSTPTTELPLR